MKTLTRKIKLGIAAIATSLLLPTMAQADGKGLMLEGGGYWGLVNEKVDDNIKIDSSSFAYNLGVGWRFNKWIGIDGGYWGLGEYKSKSDNPLFDGAKVDSSALTLGVIGSIPIWIIDIYGRLGAAWWENEGDVVKDDGNSAYYGLGVAFNLGGSLDLYGEWNRFDLESDLDLFGLGIRWTF